MKKLMMFLIVLMAIFWMMPSQSQASEKGMKFTSETFLSYKYDLSSTKNDLNGVFIDRIRLGVKNMPLAEDFTSYIRIEIKQKKDGGHDFRFKNLELRHHLDKTLLHFGIISIPTYNVPEKLYPRLSAKAFMDHYKVYLGSHDSGIGIKGGFLAFKYDFSILNGNADYKETSKSKDVLLRLTYKRPINNYKILVSMMQGYGAVDSLGMNRYASSYTLALSGAWGNLAVEYISARKVGEKAMRDVGGYAVFGKVNFGKVFLMGRYDIYDPDKNISDNSQDRIIIGMGKKASKHLQFIVDYTYESYDNLKKVTSSVVAVKTGWKF